MSSLRPAIQSHQRLWIDIYFVIALGIIWETNAYNEYGRWTFNFGLGRTWFPNWTAIYCFLFAMLAVRWRLPFALIAALTMGFLTESRNFALALGVVGWAISFYPFGVGCLKKQAGQYFSIYLWQAHLFGF